METRSKRRDGDGPDSLNRPPIRQFKKGGTESDESTKAQTSDKKTAKRITRRTDVNLPTDEEEGGSNGETETSQSSNAKVTQTTEYGQGDKADESDDDSESDYEKEITKEELKPSSNTSYNRYSSKGLVDQKISKRCDQNSKPKIAEKYEPRNYVPTTTTRLTGFSDGEEENKTSFRQQKDVTRNQRRVTRKQMSLLSGKYFFCLVLLILLFPSYHEEKEETPQMSGSSLFFNTGIIVLCGIIVAVAFLAFKPSILMKPDTSKSDEFKVLQDFRDRFRKLPIMYTNQARELWSRSERILELHLKNGKENKAPAILLLTAAQDGEHMLHCVGNKLAKTYASSLDSDYTEIYGPDRKSEDSEDVKFEIDNKLSEGFNATARAAVLHRLELLPPGSLLILYKYCDHENAHFKNVALVLTVLLDDPTLTHDIPLSELEEKVRDFFNNKFIDSDTKMSHNKMDVDKLSGVWSRISHVVLPVFPEKHVGERCEESETKV